jgi:hypothetical protein
MKMNNITQIELIKEHCLKNRIKNEYKELTNIYTINNKYEIFISYDPIISQVMITLIEKNNNNEYTFIVDRKYPFHPPRFHFNNQPYSHYLKLSSQRFTEYLKKFTNKACLCCSSLSCKYNWSPAIKLKMFIDELNIIRQHKRNIVYKILAEKVKDKYLIDDIDLDSFLFPSIFS